VGEGGLTSRLGYGLASAKSGPGCALSNLKGYTLNLIDIVPGPNLTTQSLIQYNTTYTGSY